MICNLGVVGSNPTRGSPHKRLYPEHIGVSAGAPFFLFARGRGDSRAVCISQQLLKATRRKPLRFAFSQASRPLAANIAKTGVQLQLAGRHECCVNFGRSVQ